MTLETKIREYQTPPTAVELVRQTKIVLLVGIAGAGKDTIKKRLLVGDDFRDIVSHTTRQPRQNNGMWEQNDTDYHFVDLQTIETMVNDGAFIETKHVHDTVYGTSIAEVQKIHDAGKIAITDLDVQGVAEYKELSSNVVAIFILPPSYEVWRRRLQKRYATAAEFEAEYPKRRASAIRELEHALAVPYYHFIINDDLDTAVRIADEIAHKPDVFHRKDDEARLAARDILETIKAAS